MNKFILVNNAPVTPRMLGISDECLNLKIIDFLDEKKVDHGRKSRKKI